MGHRPARLLTACLPAGLVLVLASCLPVRPPVSEYGEDTRPLVSHFFRHQTMHSMACDLDCLEEHIDKFGSVVAKQPDVWGQARLTKYRDEFEKEMAKNLTTFKLSLQGSVSRSDQAYAANALAISAAISGPQATIYPLARVQVQNTSPPGTTLVAPTPITVPDAQPNTDVFAGFSNISRSGVRGGLNVGFATMANGGISLEPTIVLDQQARYLDHLNQIRRDNEGDDTADSPGYSLNLVRIPVSVLPGKATQKGYGAEATFTLTPYLGEELLPSTFRQLVTNDLVDLLALPVAKLADYVTVLQPRGVAPLPSTTTTGSKPSPVPPAGPGTGRRVQLIASTAPSSIPLANTGSHREGAIKPVQFDSVGSAATPCIQMALPSDIQVSEETILNLVQGGSARQRAAVLPLPPSQVVPAIGRIYLSDIFNAVDPVVLNHVAAQNKVYILDVRSVLREEIETAYDFLKMPEAGALWSFAAPEHGLAKRIRARQDALLEQERCHFEQQARIPLVNVGDRPVRPVTIALAWAIMVESALLNERLIQDMKDTASAKGCSYQNVECMPFYLPDPPAEAREAFKEYVRCRWPIHVFALDPYTQDQNLAEAYGRRQEMQLALSLAFVSGNISARNMSRYARRIEEDMETVSINRTQVGFSHGDDTFGWRFYPRFQTPEFESNLTSLFRDQLIGGPSKNAEIRQERLEPGIRECVAIVMMPSFVPYVTCEATSNWFKLTHPNCKVLTAKEAIRLGKVVKTLQDSCGDVKHADRYRGEDLAGLMAKTKQLEARLPYHSMMVQVPYENTLGGFEMFNTGVTDLAPQLRGWYGGPGINPAADTQLFLVGDHFSVHHTVVTAGGQDVKFELISRQIMRVTIPKGTLANTRPNSPPGGAAAPVASQTMTAAPPSELGAPCLHALLRLFRVEPAPRPVTPTVAAPSPSATEFKYVDVHVATPYGVTAHLEIPVVPGDTPTGKKTGLTWNVTAVTVPFCYAGSGIARPIPALMAQPGVAILGSASFPAVSPALSVKWDKSVLGNPPGGLAQLELTIANPYADTTTGLGKDFPSATIKIPFPTTSYPPPNASNEMVVNPDALADQLFNQFGTFFKDCGGVKIPPIPLHVTRAVVTLFDSKNNVLGGWPVQLGNDLTINWANNNCPCPCPPK